MIRVFMFLVIASTALPIIAANGSDSNSYAGSSGLDMVESNMEVPNRNMLNMLETLYHHLSIDEQPELTTRLLFSCLKWIMDLVQFDSGSIALKRFGSYLDGMNGEEPVLQWLDQFLAFLHSDRGRSLPTDLRCKLYLFTTRFYTNLPLTMIDDTTSLQFFIEATTACDDDRLNSYLTDQIPDMDHDFIWETIKCMYRSSRDPPSNQIRFLLDRIPSHILIALYTSAPSSSSSDRQFEGIISTAALKQLIVLHPSDLLASSEQDHVDIVKLFSGINALVESSILTLHYSDDDPLHHIRIMQNAPLLLGSMAPRVMKCNPTADKPVIAQAIAKALFGAYSRLSKMNAKFQKGSFAMKFIELLKEFDVDFGTFAFEDLAFNTWFLTDMRNYLCRRPMSSFDNQIPSSDQDLVLKRLMEVIHHLLSVEFKPSLLMENLGRMCYYMSPPLEPHPAL